MADEMIFFFDFFAFFLAFIGFLSVFLPRSGEYGENNLLVLFGEIAACYLIDDLLVMSSRLTVLN